MASPCFLFEVGMCRVAVRILIADDNELVRSVISDIILREGWVVCGAFADGDTAVVMAAELKPDIVVLDLRMPQLDGIGAGRAIKSFLPNVPLLLYTTFTSAQPEVEAKELGFQAVVHKGDAPALTLAIRNALSAAASPGVAKAQL